MKYKNYQIEIIKYIISYLRQNEDIKNILLAIGERYNAMQDIIIKLLDTLTIAKAEGFLLDNIGTEVGAEREEVDLENYFCVNLFHVNVPRRFYFMTSQIEPETVKTLEDKEFIQKIMTTIASNISCGTRNENLNIIKTMTNADNVIIKKIGKCQLDVYLTGANIIYTNKTIEYIQNILADGVYLNEVHINE